MSEREGSASHDRAAEDESAAHRHDPAAANSPDEKPRPEADTAETMQHDHDSAAGRQRYADARPGDYSHDFQADNSGSHPVKDTSGDELDERGVPKIANTERPKKA